MDLPVEFRIREHIRNIYRQRQINGDFLEIGCGDGFNLEKFSEWGLRGRGIDIFSEAVAKATARRLPGIEVIEGDFRKVQVQPASVVFLLNCLEHIEDDRSFLAKTYQAVKPGGFLFLAVPTRPQVYGFADLKAGHYRRYIQKDLEKTLEDIGFKMLERANVGFPIGNLYLGLYNRLNTFFLGLPPFSPERWHTSITNHYDHFPWIFRKIAPLAFPVLSFCIRLDHFFKRTSWGNYDLFVAAKQG